MKRGCSDESHTARSGTDVENRNDRARIDVRWTNPRNRPFARVTEPERRSAQLLARSLVLVPSELFIEQLQTVRHHPDARALRPIERRQLQGEVAHA